MLPFFGAMQDGAERAAQTPEEADDAGREHVSALTRLIMSIVNNIAPPFIREQVLVILQDRELVREVHHHTEHHHRTEHVVIRRVADWAANWTGILLGALVGLVLSWITMTQINASLVKLAGANGAKVVASAAVDNGWFIAIWTILLTLACAGAGGVIGNLLGGERDEQ